jgi:hypothetical protein
MNSFNDVILELQRKNSLQDDFNIAIELLSKSIADFLGYLSTESGITNFKIFIDDVPAPDLQKKSKKKKLSRGLMNLLKRLSIRKFIPRSFIGKGAGAFIAWKGFKVLFRGVTRLGKFATRIGKFAAKRWLPIYAGISGYQIYEAAVARRARAAKLIEEGYTPEEAYRIVSTEQDEKSANYFPWLKEFSINLEKRAQKFKFDLKQVFGYDVSGENPDGSRARNSYDVIMKNSVTPNDPGEKYKGVNDVLSKDGTINLDMIRAREIPATVDDITIEATKLAKQGKFKEAAKFIAQKRKEFPKIKRFIRQKMESPVYWKQKFGSPNIHPIISKPEQKIYGPEFRGITSEKYDEDGVGDQSVFIVPEKTDNVISRKLHQRIEIAEEHYELIR